MKPLSLIALFFAAALSACAGSAQRAEAQIRLATAKAMFEERCTHAGEFIHRTADNVDGILLMKLRPNDINRQDQYALDDPYGSDVTGKGYFAAFLQGKDAKGSLVEQGGVTNGYPYVDAIDPKDGQRYRYTGSIKEVTHTTSILMGGDGKTKFKTKDFVLDKVPAPNPPPRYGVTYDDISTREERDYWIAGSSLKVIDLQTNEVMAERIGYMIDPGQGNTSGGRAPWLMAEFHACPAFPKTSGGNPFKGYQTRNFVEKILRIKQSKMAGN